MSVVRLDGRLLAAIVAIESWSRGGLSTVHRLLARAAPRFNALGSDLHPVPTLVGCLAGVVRLNDAHGHRDLHPGELLAIAAGAWHQHAPLRPGSLSYSLGTRHRHADLVIEDAAGVSVLGLPQQPSADILASLVGCADAVQRLALSRQLAGQLAGAAILHFEIPDAVARMAAFLKARLDRPLRIGEVLDASGLGRRQARRLFLHYYGSTPKQVLTRYRLALAGQQLREGAGIAVAATAGGFASRAELTRTWRRVHGETPSAARHRPAPD